jgi:Negative regulator of beta-lactamase expression
LEIIPKFITSGGDRLGTKPIIIVNHISAGTMQSMYNHFSNPANLASSTFGVSRKGEIVQYLPFELKPWTNGRIQQPTAPIIKELMGDPNRYSVTIEHEGYANHGLDGNLTEEQFLSTCWLHKHIQTEVLNRFGVRIPLNSHQVIGHCHIDSVGKPFCPGRNFPWTRLYSELAIADKMTMDEYSERIDYLSRDGSKRSTAYAIAERVKSLGERLTDPVWGAAARAKLNWLIPVLDHVGGEATPEGIVKRVLELYSTAMGSGRYSPEGVRKLLLFEPIMRERGLL